MSKDLIYRNRNSSCMVEMSEGFTIHEKNIWRSLLFEDENPTIHEAISRLYFAMITLGRAKIVCVSDKENKVIHTSYLIPKCYKFKFLGINDFEIGPCKTAERYRGKGIYPSVLKYIISRNERISSEFYMIVDEKNVPSRRGCEKAGFDIIGSAKRNSIIKTWDLEREGYHE